ncbi:MAG: GNAT family N-acetyltransferase [Comamonas sp.]
MTTLRFERDAARDPRVVAFLSAHLEDMHRVSPPESVHALDTEQLRLPGIRFWMAWAHDALVGSCALKTIDSAHLELKTMRIDAKHRGTGAAQQLLDFVLSQAQQSGTQRISLETGSQDFFLPARRLYARNGFVPCAPFGSYQPDPHSCFMSRVI